MKLFIPTETDSVDSKVANKLGRANYFYIYDTVKNNGCFYKNQFFAENHGAGVKTAAFILKEKTDVLISPRLGEKALDLLLDTDVKIYQSNPKSIKGVIEDFFERKLEELY